MLVETRSSPARAAAGTVESPAANLAMELIGADQVLQWTLEGKCFTASLPVESDAPDGEAVHNDEAHTYMLTSDTAGTKLVVPIATTICPNSVSAASAVQEYSMYVIRPTNECAIKRTVSGTGMTIHNNRSDGYGTQVATALYTVESSVLADAEWNEICAFHVNINSDNNASIGINEHTMIVCHFKDAAPIVLYKGASLAVTTWSATTDPKFRISFQWAELDASVYLP